MTQISKLEINIKRLLTRCELIAKDDPHKDWKLEKVCELLLTFMFLLHFHLMRIFNLFCHNNNFGITLCTITVQKIKIYISDIKYYILFII